MDDHNIQTIGNDYLHNLTKGSVYKTVFKGSRGSVSGSATVITDRHMIVNAHGLDQSLIVNADKFIATNYKGSTVVHFDKYKCLNDIDICILHSVEKIDGAPVSLDVSGKFQGETESISYQSFSKLTDSALTFSPSPIGGNLISGSFVSTKSMCNPGSSGSPIFNNGNIVGVVSGITWLNGSLTCVVISSSAIIEGIKDQQFSTFKPLTAYFNRGFEDESITHQVLKLTNLLPRKENLIDNLIVLNSKGVDGIDIDTPQILPLTNEASRNSPANDSSESKGILGAIQSFLGGRDRGDSTYDDHVRSMNMGFGGTVFVAK